VSRDCLFLHCLFYLSSSNIFLFQIQTDSNNNNTNKHQQQIRKLTIQTCYSLHIVYQRRASMDAKLKQYATISHCTSCRATRTFIVHCSSVSIVNVLEIQRSIISFRLAVHSQTSCTDKTNERCNWQHANTTLGDVAYDTYTTINHQLAMLACHILTSIEIWRF